MGAIGLLDKLMMVFQLVPIIINTIRSIEQAIPGQGKGEQKLAAVREILESTDEHARELWPGIRGAVSALVKLFNSSGVFQTSNKED